VFLDFNVAGLCNLSCATCGSCINSRFDHPCIIGYSNAVPKQENCWQLSIVTHLELYHWLKHWYVTVELSNVHSMLNYEASGGSICTAIIFWRHANSDILLSVHR